MPVNIIDISRKWSTVLVCGLFICVAIGRTIILEYCMYIKCPWPVFKTVDGLNSLRNENEFIFFIWRHAMTLTTKPNNCIFNIK